jgi:CRP-like cAMP-binding protein
MPQTDGANAAGAQQHTPPTSSSVAVGHQDIQRILTSLRTQRFGHGDVISREGQVERIWHLLLDGQIEMSQRDAQGKNVVMNHVFPGEHFGAWELMSPDGQAKPRRKTGRCVAELCEVLTLPQSDLEVLTNTFAKVRERMARQSRMRTREMLRSYLRAELTDYKEEIYEAGEIVYAQGEVCDSFFIVLEGEVDVTRESNEHRGRRHSVVVEQLGEGDFFPLGVLGIGGLRQNTRGATVSARVHTKVARVSGEALRNFAETRVSHAQIAVVADLAEDLIVRHEMRARRGGFSSTLVHDEENGREGTSFPVRKQNV